MSTYKMLIPEDRRQRRNEFLSGMGLSTAHDKQYYVSSASNMLSDMMKANGGPFENDQALDVLYRTMEAYRQRALAGDVMAQVFDVHCSQPDGQTAMLLLSSWANCGFRQLVTSHRLAAALMSTRISNDVLDSLQPPWPAFSVDVPKGLLFLQGKDGSLQNAVFGVVRRGPYGDGKIGWSHTLYSEEGTCLWGFNDQASMAANRADAGSISGTAYDTMTSTDERTTVLFWRLVFGLCLVMQERSNIKESKAAKKPYNHRNPGPPVVRTYVIGKPPTVDCRQSVVDYVRGERKGGPITVQTLVCGHWRQQPHGPHSSLRKTIWLEPYWRGPEDAPILVKPVAVSPAAVESETI